MQLNFLKTGMSKGLSSRDKEYIWHPYSSLSTKQDNLVVKSAQGIYLHTEDGRKIIDAISSWWVNLHGHSHPYIVKKLT